jgi:hypothetical protein
MNHDTGSFYDDEIIAEGLSILIERFLGSDISCWSHHSYDTLSLEKIVDYKINALTNKIYVHMDLQQSGLQGIDSWGSQPLAAYRIPYANHQYSYWIKPIK